MHKDQVVLGLGQTLTATEQSVDAAIAQAAAMVQTMITARTELSVSPVVGAEAQAKMMQAIAALGEARMAVVAAHQEMAKAHRKMGWGTYAAGPLDKGDDWTRPIEGARPDLRVA